MANAKTYAGSMAREGRDLYSYRGFAIVRIQGSWAIEHGPGRSLGVGASDTYHGRLAVRKTRNQAGSYVDRFLARTRS